MHHLLIDQSYENYKKTKNKNEIYKCIYFINSKELSKIYYDLDVRLNFIVEFLENRLDSLLENFQKIEQLHKENIAFSKYLRGALRNSFLNYLKKYKIFSKKSQIVELDQIFSYYLKKEENFFDNNLEFWALFFKKLEELDIMERIIFKLYFHFELNTKEIKYLIQKNGYKKTKELLKKINHSYLAKVDKNNKINKILYNFFTKSNSHILNSRKFEKNFYREKVIPVTKLGKLLNFEKGKIYKILFKVEKSLYFELKKEKNIYFYYSECA